ncbi:MAG: transglutaminase domain-containing protein [Lentisphaeria bacterium]|nr:transglutaminase domain-containing protein [Lentisphaeria bacterium]
MESGPNTKQRLTLTLMGCAILPAAVVFMVTGDAPQTLLLTLVGLGLSFAFPRPLERSVRSFVYTGLGAVVAAVVSDQALPVEGRRFFLLPAELYCPMVLYLAVALTFFDQRESNVAAVIGLALVAMMMAGNVLGFQIAHERLPLKQEAERYLHAFYATAVVLQLGACLLLLPRAPFLIPLRDRLRRRQLGRLLATGMFLAVGSAATVAVMGTAEELETLWQTGFVRLMQRYMLRHGRHVVFGRDVDLWRTVPHHAAEDERVALRALAEAAPGYLRGRVYRTYNQGRWTAANRSAGLNGETPGGQLAYTTFQRPEGWSTAPPAPGAQAARIEVLPAADFRSDVLLAPGRAATFELIAESLAHSPDGELTPNDWEDRVGYAMGVPEHTPDSPFPGPPVDAATVDDYLGIPSDLREPLRQLGQGIFGGQDPPTDTAAAVPALARFFQENCRYELGVTWNRRLGDPVLQFLTGTQTGHCELFASAAVLLLRSRGIPARYVTGMVCHENLGREYWLARLRDCHAWAEAYDAESNAWTLVEMTPADGIPHTAPRLNPFQRARDRLAFAWQHVMALLKRGTFAEAIVAALRALLLLLRWVVLNPVGAPMLLLLLFWALHRRRARRRALDADGQSLPAARATLQRAFHRLVQSLRHRLPGLDPHPTTGQVLEALRKTAPTAAETLGPALARYETLRFGPLLPQNSAARDLAQQLRDLGRKAGRAAIRGGNEPGDPAA